MNTYPARLEVDYPQQLNRLTTAFRFVLILPIAVVLSFLTDGCGPIDAPQTAVVEDVIHQLRDRGVAIPADVAADVEPPPAPSRAGGAVTGGLFAATLLLLVFRQKYPRWWFDFHRGIACFAARVAAYAALLTDRYPSTDEEQDVHLSLDYPDAAQLNRWLPLVKWFLAIPHYIVLAFLGVGAVFAVLAAWFVILFTGRYPRALFDYVVGVGRWALRVQAYAFLLITDEYPPFSLAR